MDSIPAQAAILSFFMPKPKKKNPGGAPPKYKEDYARMAMELFRSTPFSIAKLSRVLGVCRATIYNWMGDYPEFLDSISQGRKIFDGQKIERSLIRRATGFRYTETSEEFDEDGNLKSIKKTRKLVLPDVAAIKHWQVNMDQARWSDKSVVKHEVELLELYEKVTDNSRAVPGAGEKAQIEDLETE